MSERLAKKLLIIGWDAADWKMIEQLLARDQMPNFRALIRRGVHADLSTLEPKLSPLLWSSIATGKTADKHGILNFIEPNPNVGGVRVSSSTSRKTKALWNILTQSGLRANVVSWYASHPAEPIRGMCVSNLFQENAPPKAHGSWPMPDGAVHPAESASKVAKQRMHPAQLAESMLRPMIPKLGKIDPRDARLATLKKLVAQCHSVHRAALSILSEGTQWDCTMVFYDTIDAVGHHFMEFHPPRMAHVGEHDFSLFQDVMVGVYRMHDALLGQLLKVAGDDATVILLSDHGFYSDELRPKPVDLPKGERAAIEAAWHRPFGVLAMAGPGIKADGERVAGASLLDITPTALALLGLPVGQDMDGRVLANAFDRQGSIESIPSWDSAPGEAGMHPTEMRQDPFESQDALKQLVDLGYIAAPSEDMQATLDLLQIESRFNLAVVYTTTNRPNSALPIFEQLVEKEPHQTRYVMGMSQCRYALMQWEACAASLREFLKTKPDNTDARLLLAAALGSGGRHSEAEAELAHLEKSVSESKRRNMQVSLGDGYSILRDWTTAERFYREALLVDPRNSHVLHGLARALLAQRRFEDAADHCLSALEVQYAMPHCHYLLGVVLAWMGDDPHAVQSFNVAVSMQPGLLDAHRFLAMLHRKMGDEANAAHHEQAAKKLTAQSGDTAPLHEAPMGPGEWAASRALPAEGVGVKA